MVAAATSAGRRRRASATGATPRAAGYTYIGVLALVALMGLAAGVASEVWHVAQKRDKEQELLFIGGEFRRALARYAAEGGGYPRTLEDLLKDPRTPGVRRHLRKLYRDPMTGRAEWGLVRPGGQFITGVYSLSEEEPLKKSEFSLVDQGFEGKKKYSEWVFFPKATQSAAPAPQSAGTGTAQAGAPRPLPGTRAGK